MILQPDLETLPRHRLRALQADRLGEIVRFAYERVPLYTQRFEEIGVKPDDISGLEDLAGLPFTRKSDLRDTYPFGMFAVPMSEAVRIHAGGEHLGLAVLPISGGSASRQVDLMLDFRPEVLACTPS